MSLVFYILLAIFLCLLLLIARAYIRKKERLIEELSQRLSESEQQLRIAEENFYTRKMNQAVFENLLRSYKAQMIEIELQINKLRGNLKVDVHERLKVLGSRIQNPTKAQAHRLERLLEGAELLTKEIGFLHNKLLKHEIDEELFNYLSEEKQRGIIKTEAKIRMITKASEKNPKEKKTKTTPERAPKAQTEDQATQPHETQAP